MARLPTAALAQTINDVISLPYGLPNLRTITTSAGGGDIVLGGVLSGPGGLDKEGAGTLTLAGSNTYAGSTNVGGGTLQLGVDQTLPSASVVTLNGGALNLNGHKNSLSQFVVNSSATSQSNGMLTVAGTMDGALQIGGAAGASGSYSMAGGSLNVTSQPMDVGWYGTGLFNQTSGMVTTNNYLVIGRQTTGAGTYTISGGTVRNNGQSLIVGQEGRGTLTVSGSGVVIAGANGLVIGGAYGGTGTGTVNLLSGGLIQTTAVTTGGGNWSFNFAGGTLQAATGAGASFLSGLSNAAVGENGAVIDTNGNNISLATVLSGNGGLTKAGSGTMIVQANDAYAGPTVISGGVLQLARMAPKLAYDFSSGAAINTGSNSTAVTTTPVGSPFFSATGGPDGLGVMCLNGSNYLAISASSLPDLSGSANYTIGVWIKTTQAGGSVLYKGTTGAWTSGDENFYLTSGVPNSNNGGTGTHFGGVQWGGGFVGGNTAVNTGTWKFISIVRSGNASTVYVNGVSDGVTTNGMVNAEQGTQTICLGYNSGVAHDGALMLSGSISGTYVYGTALNQSQIQSLMNAGPASVYFNLPSATALSITASGAALDMEGARQTVASLSGVAGSKIYLGGGTLTVTNNGSTTFAGNISDGGGASSGSGGSLLLAGSGKLVLTGTNTYAGGTFVEGNGTLIVTNRSAWPMEATCTSAPPVRSSRRSYCNRSLRWLERIPTRRPQPSPNQARCFC